MKRGPAEGVLQPGNSPYPHPWRKQAIPNYRRRVNRQARAAARVIARMRGR